MKIINLKDNTEFMSVKRGETAKFANPYIQKGFEEFGIIIPPALVKDYSGKERVYLDDPEFEKAFRELYFAFEMDPGEYQLVET
jgi:hypothetical protein